VLGTFKGTAKTNLIEQELTALFQSKNSTVKEITGYTGEAGLSAVKKFEDALTISPDNYDAAILLANLNYQIGSQYKDNRRLVEAANAFEKTTRTIDDFMAIHRLSLSDHFDLEVIYAKANLGLGVLALNANRLKQAVAALEKSVAGEVRFAEAHNNLGVAYARLGKYGAAAKQYQYAIELNPLLVSARLNFGKELLRQKKYKEAIASFHQAQKLKPDSALTNYNLGMAYFMQNELKQAEAEWERALALNPDFEQARQSLKVVRKKMGSP
jgi:tetratricopeptide (TPR) repeat protein